MFIYIDFFIIYYSVNTAAHLKYNFKNKIFDLNNIKHKVSYQHLTSFSMKELLSI